MKRIEKLCTVWMGRHLEYMRRKKGISSEEMGRRLGIESHRYRMRELGQIPITPSFLLRVQLALEIPIYYLWFPVREGEESPEEAVIEAAMAELLELMCCPVTVEQVLAAACKAFQVPVQAVASGQGGKNARQARTAAAIVVESIPHLKLDVLANLVGCFPRSWAGDREQARQKEGELFWDRVAMIRQEKPTSEKETDLDEVEDLQPIRKAQ